ncbi:MAG: hypothetical protein EKK47_15475 [Burkholderiales bacterium]|jgi:hypothetical protein|nr:MAG: hypothetical protein EKK47_15475 [Burkholderiales bacterium]
MKLILSHLLRPACLTLALLAGASMLQAALADTTLSGSVSDSISTAVGSASDSLKAISHSSTDDHKVAEGDYKVMQVAAVADRPGMTQLTLKPVGHEGDAAAGFTLTLPQKTVDTHQISRGGVVNVGRRPYGWAFAKADEHQTFFLVMADDWYRELPTRPVTL